MTNDKLPPAATPKTETEDAAWRAARAVESGRGGGEAATSRTVGVYDRPAARARLSLPMLVILILSALVSVVAAARFMF